MKVGLFIFLGFYSWHSCALESREPITLFIWSNQLAPIISHPDSNKQAGKLTEYNGIIVEVLSQMVESDNQNINVVLSSRRRGERELYEGKLDFTILSPQWLEHPDKLIYSSSIHVHREYLYAFQPILDRPLTETLNGKRICTKRGYKYPFLDSIFINGQALRVDSQEGDDQFQLLERQRCDFVISNEFVANTIIKENNWEEMVYRNGEPVDEIDFKIAFHPKHSEFVQRLNIIINMMRQTGKLESLILQQTK